MNQTIKTIKESEEKKIYEIVDSFLVEAKDQYGKERSLERLNTDRHLAVKNLQSHINQSHLAVIDSLIEELEGREKNCKVKERGCYEVKSFHCEKHTIYNESLSDTIIHLKEVKEYLSE